MDEEIRDKFGTIIELKLRLQKLQIVHDLRMLQREVLKAEDVPDHDKATQYDILDEDIKLVNNMDSDEKESA